MAGPGRPSAGSPGRLRPPRWLWLRPAAPVPDHGHRLGRPVRPARAPPRRRQGQTRSPGAAAPTPPALAGAVQAPGGHLGKPQMADHMGTVSLSPADCAKDQARSRGGSAASSSQPMIPDPAAAGLAARPGNPGKRVRTATAAHVHDASGARIAAVPPTSSCRLWPSPHRPFSGHHGRSRSTPSTAWFTPWRRAWPLELLSNAPGARTSISGRNKVS